MSVQGVSVVSVLQKLFKKKDRRGICAAVVPAAGSATRMQGQDKVLLPLGEVPVLIRTLRALESCAEIAEIVVVTREDLIVPVAQLCKEAALTKVNKVVLGGATRTESVLAGIREVSDQIELIAIHDGARPLVTRAVLDAVIAAGRRTGAAAPAVPVKDTIKSAAGDTVERTLDRAKLRAIQTPQVFDAGLIRAALTKALEDGAELTDDCSAVERLGMTVTLTEGSYRNMKITTPEDMAVAEALLGWEE